MEALIHKYAAKIVGAGLAAEGSVWLGGRDADIEWNRPVDATIRDLNPVFEGLNINSLLFCRPAEPYASMIQYLAAGTATIYPQDSETRTFLHDLPVVPELTAEAIISALNRRKAVIVRDRGVVSFGTVSPEQAFVAYSSVCFATFVKFMSDLLEASQTGQMDPQARRIYERAMPLLDNLDPTDEPLQKGPFTTESSICAALDQVGKQLVHRGLVDSYFGNLSYLHDGILYISQTSAALDELPGHIDPCPLDASSSAGITASSELSAHLQIVSSGKIRAILHGHPKFAVILSLDCEREGCELDGQCHLRCDRSRMVGDIPIVPGEVGGGPHGLYRTLPPALEHHRGAIVYGHGLFTTGTIDFNEAYLNLLDIERMCRDRFVQRL